VGPQEKFCASQASEVLYGGAAGGGKSAATIALPLKWITNPKFQCLYLRREDKYLGDAVNKSRALYPKLGGTFVQSPKKIWTFQSGAKIWLNHCEHEQDISNYDSEEFQLVIFEELQHFTKRQFIEIQARIRRTDPSLPLYARATCNPGGPGHEWIFEHFGAWLNPKHPNPAKGGEIRWYIGDKEVPRGTPDALSRQFIPATLLDNPHIGPEYRAQLMKLDAVRRAQLLEGDWLVQPGDCLYFKREWFPLATEKWVDGACVRAWDLGATKDGDWTVGVLMRRLRGGRFVIEDVDRFRGPPGDVEQRILSVARRDGVNVAVRLPQDPGQAGVSQIAAYYKLLQGFRLVTERPTGDKVTRAGPLSSQAQAGNIALKVGAWTPDFVAELEAFPKGSHDDQVDAAADAFNWLARATDVKPQSAQIYTRDFDWQGIGIG